MASTIRGANNFSLMRLYLASVMGQVSSPLLDFFRNLKFHVNMPIFAMRNDKMENVIQPNGRGLSPIERPKKSNTIIIRVRRSGIR